MVTEVYIDRRGLTISRRRLCHYLCERNRLCSREDLTCLFQEPSNDDQEVFKT